MSKFLVDEDMPRSTATLLREMGFEVLDARDCGLRGKSDDEVFARAQKEGATILTGDVGFGNLLHFPTGTHAGIIVARFPNEISTSELNSHVKKALATFAPAEFRGSLIIIEPGKIRIRKP
jgi:predicted nuclease of predicted toxin-antitoxin system